MPKKFSRIQLKYVPKPGKETQLNKIRPIDQANFILHDDVSIPNSRREIQPVKENINHVEGERSIEKSTELLENSKPASANHLVKNQVVDPKTSDGHVSTHDSNKKGNSSQSSKLITIVSIVAAIAAVAALGIALYNLISPLIKSNSSTSVTLRWNSTGSTAAGNGSHGLSANRLSSPMGIAIDSANTIYVSDLNNSRVQKWPKNAWTGTTVAGQSNGSSGSSSAHLYVAAGIAIDDADNVYVADVFNCRIQFWMSGASSGITVAGTVFMNDDSTIYSGTPGTANNQLGYPYGLVRDSATGTLYIGDTNNHRVMKYSVGASSGTIVAGGYGQGFNKSQLNFPVGLYYDSSSNSLVIANAGANNIVRWTIGQSTWTIVAGNENGTLGTSSSELNYPVSIRYDQWGNLYVADTYNHRIQMFAGGGRNGITIAGVTGTIGNTASLLNYPYGLAFDSELNLYVADGNNNRVQKFQRY